MIYKVGIWLILTALLITKTSFTQAQAQPDTLKAELEAVQVNAIHTSISAANAPLSLAFSRRSDMEMNTETALSLDKIANQLPGIWVNDRENYALGESMTIRGLGWRAAFGVRGIQVVMDGIPLTVADGQAMLTTVDPAFIRNIELIRGPASTFWGNSSGGVLYLSTPSPGTDNPFLKVRSIAGSYGMLKEEIKLSKSFGRHNVMGYASYLSEDGYRDHSSVNITRSGLKGSIDLSSDSRLEYMGAFVAMPWAQHPSGLTAEQISDNPRQANSYFEANDAGKAVYQGQAGLNYYKDSSLGFLTLTGYGIYRDLSNPLPFGIIDLNRWAGGLRGTLEREFNDLKLNLGFDTKWQHDDRTEYENDNGSRGAVDVDQLETVNNQALFTTASYNFHNFSMLSGLRFDRLTFNTDTEAFQGSGSRTFHALSPSLGLAYNFESVRVFTNLSTSFEAPTTTELVNRPDGGNGFNPELKPERTLGLEIGSRGSLLDDRISFDFALYQLWIRDLLFPYQLEADGPTFYRNQGSTNHSGLEGRLSVRPFTNVTADLSYNHIRAEFEQAQTPDGQSLQGNQVPGIPRHRFRAAAGYTNSAILVELSYQHVSGFPVNNLNTVNNQSYGFVDAKLGTTSLFNSSQLRIQPFVNVNNLLDINYNGSVVVNAAGDRYFEPATGRNWQFGLSVEFH